MTPFLRVLALVSLLLGQSLAAASSARCLTDCRRASASSRRSAPRPTS